MLNYEDEQLVLEDEYMSWINSAPYTYNESEPAGPPERHTFSYTQYGSPERVVTMDLNGRELHAGLVIGEFAAHLVACGYSPELIEQYIPSWANIRSPC